MLQSGVNISITHALYSSIRKEHLFYIKKNNYTLILDEEVSFIEPLGDGYTKSDFEYLRSLNQITVEESNGRLVWIGDNIGSDTKYTKLANMCRLGMVYQAKRSEHIFVTQLPMDLITSAERVILLTYLFNGSILDSFLKMKGIGVVPFTEVNLLTKSKKDFRDLIEFVGDRQVKDFASDSLSSTWYRNTANQADASRISKAIRAVGVSNKVTGKDLLWCTPSSLARPKTKSAKKISAKGYGAGTGDIEDGIADGCFLACTSRATNAYRNRSVLVHAYNRFPHQTVSAFLQDYGVPVDPNNFALSEILQWVWRSQIRDGKPIKLCILSKRMRRLFQEWLMSDD